MDATQGAELIGRTIGNWQLLKLLGEGAFGAVYEAQNTGIAGRRAAVKVLHPQLSMHLAIKQRFLNEASAASRAEHENIVQVFDGGITPDGFCYSVMELLRGAPLSKVIGRGRLDLARTINVGAQVAGALAAAHAIGIVHRDLKPDNVFVVERATNAEFIKVLDFGVAKLRGDALATGAASLTKTGMMIGTPGYMSPEQWKTLPDIDGRADIYALGVILFECLTGTLPFSGATPYEWLRAHLEHPVPDLAQHAPVPSAMASLVQRMMAKEREERPQSMADVIHALQALRSLDPARRVSGPHDVTLGAIAQAPLAVPKPASVEVAIEPPAPKPVVRSEAPRPSTAQDLAHASTLGGGAGEVAAPRRSSSRAALFAIVFGGIALGGGGYFLATHGGAAPPPSSDDVATKVARLSLEADHAMKALDWDGAVAKCEQAIALDPNEGSVRDKKQRAISEKQAATLYAQFEASANAGDTRGAIVLYDQLPSESLYRERGAARATSLRQQVAAEGVVGQVLPTVATKSPSSGHHHDGKSGHAATTETVANGVLGRFAGNPRDSLGAQPSSGEVRKAPAASGDAQADPDAAAADARRRLEAHATPAAPTRNDAAKLIDEGFRLYVTTQYAQAIEKARAGLELGGASETERLKGWKTIGASSCFLHDKVHAVESWNRLDAQGRQFLSYVCKKNGIDVQ